MQADCEYPPGDVVIPEVESMAIRNEDWTAIHKAIADAIEALAHSLRPHGWRRLTHWLREWGLAGTAIAIPVTLLSISIAVGIFAAYGIRDNTQFRTRTEDRLKHMESSLEDLDSNFKAIRLKQLSDSPRNPKSIASAKEIINQAIAGKVPISPEVVESAGVPFVEAGAKTPTAWDAALSFLTYRSVLNVSFAPSLLPSRPAPSNCYTSGRTHILTSPSETSDEAAKSQTISAIGGTVSGDDAARLEEISNPTKEDCGAQFILYEMPRRDNTFVLDGLHLKNVIVRNTRVAYHGGPVSLQNVYFVNCTFDFPSVPQTRNLASTILAAPNITFNQTA
jgi:hypothetical protein